MSKTEIIIGTKSVSKKAMLSSIVIDDEKRNIIVIYKEILTDSDNNIISSTTKSYTLSGEEYSNWENQLGEPIRQAVSNRLTSLYSE